MAKILIVEDSNEITEMLNILLQLHGHEIQSAFSKETAHHKMLTFPPELIIIDVLIGKYNGKELCLEIRAVNKTVPIILMSANPSLLTDYEECEANDMLEKPFNIDTLISKINNLIK